MVSDDIVTRLRAYNIGNIAHEASSHMEETLYEAADEIERLRADRDRWKQLAITDHLDVCNLDDHELCLSYLEWKVNKAVRGD